MAANMKVNTRRLGEDIAALSDRLAAMQRTAAELAPALDAPRADALTECIITWDTERGSIKTRGVHANQVFAAIAATMRMLNILMHGAAAERPVDMPDAVV